MEDRGTVVFVEVKYRGKSSHGSGAEAVTYHKQRKLSLTAACFLAANPGRGEQICRFDVISIDPNRDEHGINWIRNAFYSTVG